MRYLLLHFLTGQKLGAWTRYRPTNHSRMQSNWRQLGRLDFDFLVQGMECLGRIRALQASCHRRVLLEMMDQRIGHRPSDR